jgi:hypothetical protein
MNDMEISDNLIASSEATVAVNIDMHHVNLSDWIQQLTEFEYQQCSVAHRTMAVSKTPDGRPLAINVEVFGQLLMVQHYVMEVAEKHYCKLVSVSDAFYPQGQTTMLVIWEFFLTDSLGAKTEFTNKVTLAATNNFLIFVTAGGLTLDQVRPGVQEDLDSHNREETYHFGKSIQQKFERVEQ